MTLYIDTTDNQKTIIRIDQKQFEADNLIPGQQQLIKYIYQSLSEIGASIQEITEINVNLGPGSFTGSRVGVTVANVLAFALNIPVNGQKPPVLPIYSSEPRITVKPSEPQSQP